ncbi:hypothetical protein J2T13_002648 [Paenibacillus sp. DS2015]|uniref:hypothetical protein n=1 Tax=Paenibacillus sp. DS2015 TaxID=3373917 RepID=UPI003D1B886D
MLSFEQKLQVLESFPQLQRKNVSLGRVNFHYEESQQDKKTIAMHLHPNGNGFVYAGLLQGYDSDEKGFVNIREFNADQLKTLVEASIHSLSSSGEEIKTVNDHVQERSNFHEVEKWTNDEEQLLSLIHDDDLWYIYTGQNVEMVFETLKEAKEYLREEGFIPSKI